MYLGLQCLDGVPKVIAAHSLLAQVLHMGSDQKIISLFSGPPLLKKTGHLEDCDCLSFVHPH